MKNPQIEFLQKRRSIRKYTEEPLTEEEIKTVLETAMYAPSAHSFFPLHYIVLREKESKQAIMDAHPHASMLRFADTAVLLCGDLSLQTEMGYLIQDGAASMMNMLHAAQSLGLGACWLGIYPRKERMDSISEYFKLPENIVPICAMALGHTEVEKDLPERIKTEKIHWAKW